MSIYDLSYFPQGVGSMPTANQYSDIFRRLLAPEEFNELGPGEKMMFDNYMDYVNQFQREHQRQRQTGTPGTQRVPQGGVIQLSGAGNATTSSRIGGRGGIEPAIGGIPEYRKRTDIYGRRTLEPTLGGMKRSMSGEIIPGTPEELRATEKLQPEWWIPAVKAETAEELATKQAQAMKAKRGLEEEQVLAGMTSEQRHKLTKEAQAAIRLQITQAKETRMGKQYYQSQSWREANAIAEREFKRDILNAKAEIDRARDKFNADERKALAEINNQASLNRAMTILDKRIAATKEINEKDRLNDIRQLYESMESKLYLIRANQSEEEFVENRANWNKAMIAARTGQMKEQPAPESPAEVERLVNGRVAIYDAQTKKFIRWK